MMEKSNSPKYRVDVPHFLYLERRIQEKEYVLPEEIAELLRTRGEAPVPEAVLQYIASYLAGEIKPPKGRPKENVIERRKRDILIKMQYNELKSIFEANEELSDDAQTLYGTYLADLPEKAPPAERAARLVASLFLYGPRSWRRVQNIVPSQE